MDLANELKQVILAGVGAAALTVEKAQDLGEQLVKKGEMTVEQGKALNEELKKTLSVEPNSVETVLKAADKLTPAQKEELIAKLSGQNDEK